MTGIAVVMAKVLISCVDLDSLASGVPDGAPVPSDDASALPDVADPCAHLQPAATSDASDGDGELPTFVLALDSVSLDPKKVPTFDLDGVCTCETRPNSAFDGGPSCTASTVICDGEGGVDDSLGAVLDLSGPIGSFDVATNRVIASGRRTLLVQIEKYNGRANDPEVVVGTLVAVGIHTKGCPSSVFEAGDNIWSVGGCGNDAWTLSPLSGVASAGGVIPFARGTGYVRNGRLVVRLNDAALVPFTNVSSIGFRAPLLVGDLVPLGEDLAPRDPARAPTEKEKRLFRIENGAVAGRVLATDVLRTLGTYQGPMAASAVCATAAFRLIHDRVCEATDIESRPRTEDLSRSFDPTRSCDALSASMGFVAIPALAAAMSDAGAPPTGCESVDAATFTCF